MTNDEKAALEWLIAHNGDVSFRDNGAHAYVIVGRKSSQLWDRSLVEAVKAVGWRGNDPLQEKSDAR